MNNLIFSVLFALLVCACANRKIGHITLGHQKVQKIAYHTAAELPKIYWEVDSSFLQNFARQDEYGSLGLNPAWFSFSDTVLKYKITAQRPSSSAVAVVWKTPKEFTNDTAFEIFQKYINESISKERLLYCNFLDTSKTLILCKVVRAKCFRLYPDLVQPHYFTKKLTKLYKNKQKRHNTYILQNKNGVWDYVYYHINHAPNEPKYVFNFQTTNTKKCVWGEYQFSKKTNQYRFSISSLAVQRDST